MTFPQSVTVRARALAALHSEVAPRLLDDLRATGTLTGAAPDVAAREWLAASLHACVRGVVAVTLAGEERADLVDAFHDAVLAEDAEARAFVATRYTEYDGLSRALGQAGGGRVPHAIADAFARHAMAAGPAPLAEAAAPLLEALAESAEAMVAEGPALQSPAVEIPSPVGMQSLTARLDAAGIPWALGGSALLAAHGLVDRVNDWDVQVDSDPEPLVKRFEDVPHSFHGHGGCHADWKLSFDAESTELIPRFAFFVPGGVVRIPFHVSGHWGDKPLASPEGWACAYALMAEYDEPALRARRGERAEQLFAWLASHGADGERVAELLREPLPDALRVRLAALPARRTLIVAVSARGSPQAVLRASGSRRSAGWKSVTSGGEARSIAHSGQMGRAPPWFTRFFARARISLAGRALAVTISSAHVSSGHSWSGPWRPPAPRLEYAATGPSSEDFVMRPPSPLLASLPPCALSLAFAASLATASHVVPVLPLTGSSNHSYEKFSPTRFPAGNYSNYDFSFADLSGCTFAPGTDLSGASFRGANLTNVDFNSSDLDGACFQGANLTNAIVPCLGGADFRGAIMTGVVGGVGASAGCDQWGPSATDECTAGPVPRLRLGSVSFRGFVAGVVFSDVNRNGLLDLGEPGVPGASVTFSGGPHATSTDSRGGFHAPWADAGRGTVGVTPPVGWDLTGPALQNYDLSVCRSAQQLVFPAIAVGTPVVRCTFGRLKALYQ